MGPQGGGMGGERGTLAERNGEKGLEGEQGAATYGKGNGWRERVVGGKKTMRAGGGAGEGRPRSGGGFSGRERREHYWVPAYEGGSVSDKFLPLHRQEAGG